MAIKAVTDALGLVARMPSGPGSIPDSAIAEITALAPPPIATFLLTSETTAEAISTHIRATNPSTVQVVSHIDRAESEKLALLEPHVRRVQVIHVEGPEALELIPVYEPYVHAFLLDSGRPNAAVAELGGTGRAHDWAVSAAFVQRPNVLFSSPAACRPPTWPVPSPRCDPTAWTYAREFALTVSLIQKSWRRLCGPSSRPTRDWHRCTRLLEAESMIRLFGLPCGKLHGQKSWYGRSVTRPPASPRFRNQHLTAFPFPGRLAAPCGARPRALMLIAALWSRWRFSPHRL